MRTLRWLVALCAFSVLLFYVTGMAEWDAACGLSMLAFFLFLFAILICALVLYFQELKRKFHWPRAWLGTRRFPWPRAWLDTAVKLLPFRRLEIDTSLSKEAAMEALSAETALPGGISGWRWTWQPGHKLFKGEVGPDGFEVTRWIDYRSSFLPLVKGTFHPTPQGTRLSVQITLHPIIWCFLVTWFGGVGFILMFLSLGVLFADDPPHWAWLLAPLGMMGFGYGLVTLPFRYEVAKASEALHNILPTAPPRELK